MEKFHGVFQFLEKCFSVTIESYFYIRVQGVMMSSVVKTVPPSEEEPVEDDPRPLKRSGKQPLAAFYREDSDDEEAKRPDLDSYFNDFDTPAEDRIKICRAYASYWVSVLPPKEKKARSKKDNKRSRD